MLFFCHGVSGTEEHGYWGWYPQPQAPVPRHPLEPPFFCWVHKRTSKDEQCFLQGVTHLPHSLVSDSKAGKQYSNISKER